MRHGKALSVSSHPDIDLNIDFILELSGKKRKWYLIITFWQSDHDKIAQVWAMGIDFLPVWKLESMGQGAGGFV